jgi:hypothetical protein
MARLGKLRPGPVGVAITLWNVWSRLSPRQRRQLIQLARTHGPKAAAKLFELRSRRSR